MKKITLGLLAHVDSGKTTLSEAMLYASGAVRSFGRVDKGESFLDSTALERKRGITIYSKQALLEYGGTRLCLMDTPGHGDLSAELERVLQILDYALLIISAPDGVTPQSERLWKSFKFYEIPTFIFFNKMDRTELTRAEILDNARSLLSDAIVDFSSEKDRNFYEQIAVESEPAMEEFLNEGTVSEGLIMEMIADRQIFPAFFGSALKQEGIEELLGGIDELTLETDYPDAFGARVFKIMRDQAGTRLTFMKVTGGTLKNKSTLPDKEGSSKINRIRVYSGAKYDTPAECQAGEVCAVEGLSLSYAGQGFGYETETVYPLSVPVKRYEAILPDGVDPRIRVADFRMLEEEEPELNIGWDEELREISLDITGDVQMGILKTTFKERFSLDVEFIPWTEKYEDPTAEDAFPEEEIGETGSNDNSDGIFLGTDDIDAIISGISRNTSAKKSWRRKKKKSFGIADGAEIKATSMHGSGARPAMGIFEPENADYLIVDGYNVIFAWEDLNELAAENLDAARISLQEKLCNWQAYTGSEVIAVFDAYKVPGHVTEVSDYLNIHVVFTKEAETADQYIEKFANERGRKYRVAVVTSDGLEQLIIRGEGCRLVSSREFRQRLEKIGPVRI